MFEHDLTLRAIDAEALGLGRFTTPASAYYGTSEHPCRKTIVRIQIPELGNDLELGNSIRIDRP